MTRPDIDAIAARAAAATPGEWRLRYLRHHSVPSISIVTGPPSPTVEERLRDVALVDVWCPLPWRDGSGSEEEAAGRRAEQEANATANLLVNAPTDLAALVAYVEALESERDRLRQVIDRVWGHVPLEVRREVAPLTRDGGE